MLFRSKLKIFSFSIKYFPRFSSHKHKMVETSQKVLNSTEIKTYWEDFGSIYSQIFEYSTQPILYSLIVNLKIYEAKKIYEESCGGGKSLPLVCSLKSKDSEYLVSDISESLLSLASKRMEHIENNFLGNLQFWDKSCFEPTEKKTWIEHFPKSNVSFKLINNENLIGLENNNFDIVFSNLSLQLVENPENMLKEAFRVLRNGGKAGFTVWGRKENSKFFTPIPTVLRRNGIELPKERSNFHLGDREGLIKMVKEAGFKNILCWYQFFSFNFYKEEEFEEILNTRGNKLMLENIPEEKRNQIKKEIMEEFMKNIRNHDPVGLEALFVIGVKE